LEPRQNRRCEDDSWGHPGGSKPQGLANCLKATDQHTTGPTSDHGQQTTNHEPWPTTWGGQRPLQGREGSGPGIYWGGQEIYGTNPNGSPDPGRGSPAPLESKVSWPRAPPWLWAKQGCSTLTRLNWYSMRVIRVEARLACSLTITYGGELGLSVPQFSPFSLSRVEGFGLRSTRSRPEPVEGSWVQGRNRPAPGQPVSGASAPSAWANGRVFPVYPWLRLPCFCRNKATDRGGVRFNRASTAGTYLSLGPGIAAQSHWPLAPRNPDHKQRTTNHA